MNKIKVYLDYETRSRADLKKVGAIKYSKDPTTEVICASYKVEGGRLKTWTPLEDPRYLEGYYAQVPEDLFEYLSNEDKYIIVAHNSLFEACITKNVLGIDRSVTNYICTAVKSASFGLPRDLENAAIVLGLRNQKNMHGNRLVKKYMKPRPAFTKWLNSDRSKPKPEVYYNDWLELLCIYIYCEQDVLVCEEIDNRLPDLIPSERRIWAINQQMNYRGVTVDIATVEKVIEFNTYETIKWNKEASRLSKGRFDTVTQRDAVLDWLESRGFDYADLRAGTVEAALGEKNLPKDVRRVLEVRQLVSKTSVKKYKAMVERADKDNRVSDLTVYYGAATGRDAGRGVQVQNLPKGNLKNADAMIKDIQDAENPEELELIYGNTSEVYSSCIRGMFIASPGMKLAVADLNAIECRVLNWIAGNDEVLDAFEMGRDPYVKTASRIFQVPESEIDSAMRFLGKTAELGCGYQMGPARFYETCVAWGVPNVTEKLCAKAVKVYRESHQKVVELWSSIEFAAVQAIKTGKTQKVGRLLWGYKNGDLIVQLPSGRRIFFPQATVRNEPAPWGEYLPKVYYHRKHPKTGKWVNLATYGGSLTESVCQGIARDVTMNGIVNLTEAGYHYLFQVHDEAICEKVNPDVEEYVELLTKKQDWFSDLPVKAEGYISKRYKK